MTEPEPVLKTLAGFAADPRNWDDPAIRRHAKRAVLDWLAAIYPGMGAAPSPMLVQSLGGELGQGRSSLVGAGVTAFPASAAWVNGTASHAVELDDIYREAISHPGSPIIAAALAVAEDRDKSGATLLRAIAAGFEVSGRVGAAVQPAHNRFFHATGTLGCIGAATAAAVVLAPDRADVIANAIATGSTFASGLQEAVRSETMTKPIHSGHAAAVGVRAALAAEQGVTGCATILDGPSGFAAALADGQGNWDGLIKALRTGSVISQITHKVHACCGHLFPVIDSVLVLRIDHRIDPAAISAIDVTTYQSALDATGRFEPRSAYECKFSMPYVIAHALSFGAVGMDAFSDTRRQSPELRRLMARCTLSADDKMTAAFPQRRHALVRIKMKDGQELSHGVSVRRGDPEAPLTDTELTTKFSAHVDPILGTAQAKRLSDAVWGLDEIAVRDLNLAAQSPGVSGQPNILSR